MISSRLGNPVFTGSAIRSRAGRGGMVETAESGSLHRLPLKVRTRLALLLPVAERTECRAVMAAARQGAAVQRQAVRQALAGLTALLQAGSSELVAGSGLPVVWSGSRPASGENVDRAEQQAHKAERLTRQSAALMASEPDGSRPALAVRAPGAVNGQEVRAARRWQSSGRAWQAEQWQDMQCYRLVATADGRLVQGEVVAGKAGRAGRAGKAGKAVQPSAERRARLMAVAGTVRMGEQD
jgi:hypothetical protein